MNIKGDHLKALDAYISYLISHSSTIINAAAKKQFAPYNLAPEQSLILFVLRLEDGLTQHEIGERINKDKANIARMAENLEQKGFIERTRDPNNRRALKLCLTSKGREIYEEALADFEKLDKEISSKVTKDELSEFKRILSKITSGV